MKAFFIGALITALSPSCAAQLIIEGPCQGATGHVTDQWQRSTQIEVHGKREKYRLIFDSSLNHYTIDWTCDSATYSIEVYPYAPQFAARKEYLYLNPCADGLTQGSVIYYSLLENAFVHRPEVAKLDQAAFDLYTSNPEK
jgi:hypothetical protein